MVPLLAIMGWLGPHRVPRSPLMRVDIRQATRDDERPLFTPISTLISEGFLPKEYTDVEQAVLASALRKNLVEKFTSRNRADSALLLAEDGAGEVVGACGIEVLALSASALEPGVEPFGALRSPTPLLSNLVVSRSARRRGIAKRLCRAAEEVARAEWGYDEVLIKVEQSNSRARSLYRGLGYRVVAVLRDSEKPKAGPGGVTFVPTTLLAMRKDLRYPPADVVAAAVAAAAVAAWLWLNPPLDEEAAAELARLAGQGRVAELAQRVGEIGSIITGY